MQGLQISEAWVRALRALPNDQRIVAWYVIDWCYANEGGAFKGQREIADELGVARRQVREAFADLIGRELVRLVYSDDDVTARPRLHAVGIFAVAPVRGQIVLDDEPGPRDAAASSRDPQEKSPTRSSRRPTSGPRSGPRVTDGDRVEYGPRSGPRDQVAISTSITGNPQCDGATTVDESPSDRARLSESARVALTEPFTEVHPDPGSSSTPAADPLLLSGADLNGFSDAKRSGPGATEKTAAPKKRSARSLALDELPPAAVALADEFRAFCIAEQPWHHSRKAEPWATHATRLKWARDFAALVDMMSDGPLDAIRVHALIRRMLAWLRTDQGVGDPRYRMIVLSPPALREKWDRIAARVVAPAPRTAAGNAFAAHPSSQRQLAIAPRPALDVDRSCTCGELAPIDRPCRSCAGAAAR
jgi:hypothetical protein